MSCQKCGSNRVLGVGGKTSDLFSAGQNYEGYVADDIGIGGGDYMEFDYCLDCGQIQGEFPLPVCENEVDFFGKKDRE